MESVFGLAASVTSTLLGAEAIEMRPEYVVPSRDTYSAFPEGATFGSADPTIEHPIRMGETGVASMKPVTVMEWMELAKQRFPDVEAFRVEQDGGWKVWTWAEYVADVKLAARSFISLGLEQFGSVNIIGFNRPEWIISNVAAIAAGAKAAGIYTTNEPDACKYIVNHCKAKVLVVENGKQLEKFVKVADQLKSVAAIIVYTDDVSAEIMQQAKSKFKGVYKWGEFMKLGENDAGTEATLDNRIAKQRPGHVCTLIYTSGTTGAPKAVMATHDAMTFTANLIEEMLEGNFSESPAHIISYLPLSHIAAQIIDIYCPLMAVARLPNPCTLWFARPDALKGSLKDTLVACRPTMFFGVPRVWEKFQEKMLIKGKSTTGVKRSVVNWCKSQGDAWFAASQADGSGQMPVMFPVAKKMLDKVRGALGLDRCKVCFTGAAPISSDTLNFFGRLGIRVFELYGMSEVCGPATCCTPWRHKVGSCGDPCPGVEVKIEHDAARDKEGEGEICMRGRNNMVGYMYDDAKTRSTIDKEGFVHSGDVGRLSDGMLYITGRIKELIITAGGENIAPVPIETSLLEILPALSNCMMVGDKRKYNIVLVSLRTEVDPNGAPTDKLTGAALEVNPECTTISDASNDKVWTKYIEDGLAAVNEKAVSRAQKLQKFYILPVDFSVDGGELTPTLKLKRPIVAQKYANAIDKLYS